MKVKINGFDVEGTPEEISEVLKLSGKKDVEYIPVYPTYPNTTPWAPSTPYPTWPTITWISC